MREPEHLLQVVHVDLQADFPPLKSLDVRSNNLPVQLTSFIGREREIAAVKESLATTRLVTLTGVGGSGKTRLALHVATALQEHYPDGIWLAQLAPLSEPVLVPKAVASALGIPEQPGRPLMGTVVDYDHRPDEKPAGRYVHCAPPQRRRGCSTARFIRLAPGHRRRESTDR